MPIYEYTCQNCGEREERITFKIEDVEYNCKKCGGKLNRNITTPALTQIGERLYDNSRDIQRGLEGKPYKGKYFEDETA